MSIKLLNEKNPKQTEYYIHYDGDEPDEIFHMPLLSDFEKGDLLIIE